MHHKACFRGVRRINSYRSKHITEADKFKAKGRRAAKQESAAKIIFGPSC